MDLYLVPPEIIVIKTIVDHFIPYRGLKLRTDVSKSESDWVVSTMTKLGFMRIDAIREVKRGNRELTIFLILSSTGAYSSHSPDLKKLLTNVISERGLLDTLDELIIVAEDHFFDKKQLPEVIFQLQRDQKSYSIPDPEGDKPYFNMYPFHNFVMNLPTSSSIPVHRILTPEEEIKVFNDLYVCHNDIPEIHSDDPPLVWLNAKEGQIIEITRSSQTSCESVYYRRVKKTSLLNRIKK
jgi:DNA-directed RNA polymerase subunit H (RpoH/RPB5)